MAGAGSTSPCRSSRKRPAPASNVSERAKFAQAAEHADVRRRQGESATTPTAQALLRDLEKNLQIGLHGRRVLLMGAGGAARGVIMPLIAHGARMIVVIANRDLREGAGAARNASAFRQRARARLRRLDGSASSWSSIRPRRACTAWCRPSPAACSRPDASPTTWSMPPAAHAVPGRARACGADVAADGLGMLVEQAAESFYIWRGVRPDTRPVLDMLRAAPS